MKEGLADLDTLSAINPGSDDLIYRGNLDNRKKAGNSLLLNFAKTISRLAPERVTQEIQVVITRNNFISNNVENMNFTFDSAVGSLLWFTNIPM